MKNKIITLIVLVLVIIAGFFIFNFNRQNKDQNVMKESLVQEKIKIAVCPTYYELSDKLDINKYQIIKTNSTAQSVNLLNNNEVDIILSGRTLKPDEPQLNHLLIGDGYSFLSNQELTIYIDQLNQYNIYTDLSNTEELKEKLFTKKIETVKNVYEYLDKGIVITSWENTDYDKIKIVHLLEENGERVKLSRRATVYYKDAYVEQAQDIVSFLKQ